MTFLCFSKLLIKYETVYAFHEVAKLSEDQHTSKIFFKNVAGDCFFNY